MRIAPALAAIPLLIVLLTWLSVHAINRDEERLNGALAEMDNFERLEAALQRDILSARAGVLRNYDPLVHETAALDASLGHLREITTADVAMRSAVARITRSVNLQEDLVEQFKGNNALLQNSLAYLARFSSLKDPPGSESALALAVRALAAAMLRLTLDTSAATAGEVKDRLNELAGQVPPAGDTAWVGGLLAHGRLLRDLLPATDAMLKTLITVVQRHECDAVRSMIAAQQSASRASARRFRNLLYGTSLLLVGLLAYVGLQLQARAEALRRRAAFEHVIARISMDFVTARAHDLDAVIEQSLADMALCVGADRAYFTLSGPSPRTHLWSGRGMAFPPGWPDRALSLAEPRDSPGYGTVLVPDVRRLPVGERRDALAVAGLWGWACVCGKGTNGSDVLLGFDAVTQPCRIMPTGELGLLRMALDVVANALSRQAIEQERARLEKHLQQARRLETVGALASGIAHNFNNIVGAILGYTDMAEEANYPTPIFGEIRRAGERGRELIDQILAFTRPRDAHRHPVSIEDLAMEAVSLLRASLPATVELVAWWPAEGAVVFGVPAQLQQVILNLCNNAAQAMDNIGRVELGVEASDVATARPLSHGSLAPGRYVRIAITDTGRGIDEAALGRIFEPFFTTRTTGNGLGLATAQEIAHDHGGAIDVQSIVGTGSRFEVWLPRIDAAVPIVNEDRAMPPFGCGETVLVVEGDSQRLARDEEILAALGYEPIGFTRAVDMQAAFRASPERFDALVLSRFAPAAATLALAAQLHAIAPSLPILLAAASAGAFEADALIGAGISNVVLWPIAAAEIASVLQKSLSEAKDPRRPVGTRNMYSGAEVRRG